MELLEKLKVATPGIKEAVLFVAGSLFGIGIGFALHMHLQKKTTLILKKINEAKPALETANVKKVKLSKNKNIESAKSNRDQLKTKRDEVKLRCIRHSDDHPVAS